MTLTHYAAITDMIAVYNSTKSLGDASVILRLDGRFVLIVDSPYDDVSENTNLPNANMYDSASFTMLHTVRSKQMQLHQSQRLTKN